MYMHLHREGETDTPCTYKSTDLFQSSSVLAYSCSLQSPVPSNPDKHAAAIPQYLPILTSIQASQNPSIPSCMDPLWQSS